LFDARRFWGKNGHPSSTLLRVGMPESGFWNAEGLRLCSMDGTQIRLLFSGISVGSMVSFFKARSASAETACTGE
jgi:hypothetical protein